MQKQQSICFVQNKLPALIWKTSFPMIGAILALLSYDLLESSLLALSGPETLTAIGFTLPLTTAITAVSIGLSICSHNRIVKSACVDKTNLTATITSTLLFCILLVSAFAVLASVFNQELLMLLGSEQWVNNNPTAEKFALAQQQQSYMSFRYSGWVLLAIIWQVNSILRALGHARSAGTIMLSWLAVKSIAAYLLLTPSFGLAQSAFAGLSVTHLIVDATWTLISLFILSKRAGLKVLSLREINRKLFPPKRDSAMVISQQLITPLSIALLTLIAANLDYSYVAAFTFILRMELLFLLIPMVLTTSMPAIIGTNYWTGNKLRVKQAYHIAFTAIIAAQLLIAAVLFFISPYLANSLCSHDQVEVLITQYFVWVAWGYLSIGCIMVYQSCLNAKGKTMQALILGISHRLIILLPLAFIGSVYSSNGSVTSSIGSTVLPNISEHFFYQGILIGHLVSGLLIIAFMYRNRTFSRPDNLNEADGLKLEATG